MTLDMALPLCAEDLSYSSAGNITSRRNPWQNAWNKVGKADIVAEGESSVADQSDSFADRSSERNQREKDAPNLGWRVSGGNSSTSALEVMIADSARMLLQLGDDWDGEGSAGYADGTIGRMNEFFRQHEGFLFRFWGYSMTIPDIGSGPSDSVDIYWNNEHGSLLVNIPASAGQSATYSGSDTHGHRSKGSFDPVRIHLGVIQCLKTLLGK